MEDVTLIEISSKKEYIPDEVDIVKDLPDRYNETKLTLMMRDPDWCYFYWDISDNDAKTHSIISRKLCVKIFRLSGIDITKNEQHTEVEVGCSYGDWYINLATPHTYFLGELGYYDDSNIFIVLARSNIVYAPRDSISNVYDDEWMVNEEIVKLLRSPRSMRESLSSATIFELIDLKSGFVGSSSSFFIPRHKKSN